VALAGKTNTRNMKEKRMNQHIDNALGGYEEREREEARAKRLAEWNTQNPTRAAVK